MGVTNEVSEAAKHEMNAIKDAAQNLKDALDALAHTSPADVAHGVGAGGKAIIDATHGTVDALIDWCRAHTGHA